MATPWVILGRIVRAEHHAPAATAAPDFTLPVAPPPGATFLAAGRSAHQDPNRPDKSPYIIAAGPRCLLAHFAVAPSTGMFFGDGPRDSYLVVVRDFRTAAGGLITASAERISEDPFPVPWNIWSVGLISRDDGHYVIVELQVDDTTGVPNTILSFDRGSGEWNMTSLDAEGPIPAQELQARKWLRHGTVSIGSKLWWFDLRWAILSCDLSDNLEINEETELVFHRLPPGRAVDVDKATELMFSRRCITVSQGHLRYVEIVSDSDDDFDGSEAATVHMWTRIKDAGEKGWRWEETYSMSFVELWKHASYRDTGLPRIVPQLSIVCPSNPRLVYFTLMRHLFGVNVQDGRVVHHELYQLTNKSVAWPQASGRFVLAWGDLPPAVAAALNLGAGSSSEGPAGA